MKVYIVMKEIDDFSEEQYVEKVFESKEKAKTFVDNSLKVEPHLDFDILEFGVE